MPALFVLKWAGFVSFVITAFGIINKFFALCEKYPDWIPVEDIIALAFTIILPVAITLGIALVFGIAYKVLFQISLYRIYKSDNKDTASSLSSLSIIGGSIFSLVYLFNVKRNAKVEE